MGLILPPPPRQSWLAGLFPRRPLLRQRRKGLQVGRDVGLILRDAAWPRETEDGHGEDEGEDGEGEQEACVDGWRKIIQIKGGS